MRYEIHEANMERLEKKLATIAKKCGKYGCEFNYEVVGETYKKVDNGYGGKIDARFVVVEASGTAIVNGWKFVATLKHQDGGNLINAVEGVEIPERYYTCDAKCEHCNTNRTRRDTYIVMNEETGEFKQVGKSCLKEFTGGLSAEAVAMYISFFDALIVGEAVPEFGGFKPYYDTKDLLLYYAETVRIFGFVKSDEPDNTKARGLNYYLADNGMLCGEQMRIARNEMERYGFKADRAENIELRDNALAWLAGKDADSNYIHNLKLMCFEKYIAEGFGVIASLYQAYGKEMSYIAKKKAEAQKDGASEYVGEVGKRVSLNVKECKVITGWETQFGYTCIYKITDFDGNVFTWKTTSYIEDGAATITGTVKAHSVYNGVKQTELQRCKVLYNKAS